MSFLRSCFRPCIGRDEHDPSEPPRDVTQKTPTPAPILAREPEVVPAKKGGLSWADFLVKYRKVSLSERDYKAAANMNARVKLICLIPVQDRQTCRKISNS